MMATSAIYSARVAVKKPTSLIKKAFSLIKRWFQNYRTRRKLAEIPEHLLDDIGITKEQANKEIRRPFWD
jgi:uncharacterized protein YjiS (DUF1127 family)